MDIENKPIYMADQYRPNRPNAAKLISSLRNTGYDSYAAVEDIIDNSIDAQARSIKVIVENENKNLRILIADNGTGMDEVVLDEALKLGSISDKEEVSDLGKFGMGLCTASISMARRLEVITREKGAEHLYSCQDLDVIIKLDEFKKIGPDPATKDQVQMFKSLVGDQGTLIILSNIDRMSDTNTAQFASKLSRDIGRIYRKFMESGIEFHVNQKKVELNDPLMLANPETKVYSDEEYDLPTASLGGRKEKIRVKIVMLPEVNKELEKEMKMNMKSQGFYVMRNNREVASGQTLDVFPRHNYLNRFRAELSFAASLDNEMGVRFSKDGVSPNQVITDFLKQEVGGQISSIQRMVASHQKTKPGSTIDHAGSEAVIAQRAKLLITPEAQVEKRSPRKNTREDEPTTTKDAKDRENFRKIKTSPKGMGARFDAVSMGREGTLYDAYQEGKVIVIRWNSDHPFYDRIILANKDSKDIISALDYLVFALASAELKNINDDNVELMANLKSIMSTNLRALLS